jgi:MiaB-like tRNA modifying enzyme
MRFYVEVYGCTMNQGEARLIMDMMEKRGWSLVDTAEDADLILLATCTVIGTTERRMMRRLRALREKRKPLIVAGCMAEIQAGKIREIAPKSKLLGVRDIEKNLPELISEFERDSQTLSSTRVKGEERVVGIVPIAQGCTGHCTYCITKLARGGLFSYPFEAILGQARREIENGAKELRLTALDTASYGTETDSSLPGLIQEVCSIEGKFRTRIGMANPDSVLPIKNELMDSYDNEKVFKFLHLPVQSGNDDIIESMGRHYRVVDFVNIVEAFRDRFEDLTLSTDIIVGFPGETEEEFLDSLDLVDEVRPDILNITRFSARPGTQAVKMKGQVVGRIVKERSRRLNSLRMAIASGNSEAMLGRTENVLTIEHGRNGSTVGRTCAYRTVVIPEKLPLGEFIRIKVVDSGGFYLIGKRIQVQR